MYLSHFSNINQFLCTISGHKFKLIKNGKKELYYFSSGKLCMYSKAPCSNYLLKKLDKKEIYGYQLYWKTE